MADRSPSPRPKGRGAFTNRSGRFESLTREPLVSEEDSLSDEDPPARPETTVQFDRTRRIIARNTSPDVGFDRSINPYRGCEHGCIYCFARPTHAFLGLSPGLDFETRIFAKPEAADLLRRELAVPGYEPAVLALGANTDPYQPAERGLGITRSVLEVLWETRHPVAVITKSHMITRDLDILAPMAAERLASVSVSLTTLDRGLARSLEPRAASPERRLETISELARAGVPVNVLTAPVIPALNDHELESLLERAAAAGAVGASYVLLRLPLEIAELFEEWLDAHYPDRKSRVLRRVREMRDGKLYRSAWGTRMKGAGVEAELLKQRFEKASRRFGLKGRSFALDTSRFRPPASHSPQLSLF